MNRKRQTQNPTCFFLSSPGLTHKHPQHSDSAFALFFSFLVSPHFSNKFSQTEKISEEKNNSQLVVVNPLAGEHVPVNWRTETGVSAIEACRAVPRSPERGEREGRAARIVFKQLKKSATAEWARAVLHLLRNSRNGRERERVSDGWRRRRESRGKARWNLANLQASATETDGWWWWNLRESIERKRARKWRGRESFCLKKLCGINLSTMSSESFSKEFLWWLWN